MGVLPEGVSIRVNQAGLCKLIGMSFDVRSNVYGIDLPCPATSVINGGALLGAAIIQPLVGWVMDQAWDGKRVEGARVYAPHNYQPGFTIMFGFVVAGLLGAVAVRETHCRYVKVSNLGG